MLLSCNSCRKEYVVSHKIGGTHFICSKCLGRSRQHYNTKLGLHPALERRFAPENDRSTRLNTRFEQRKGLNQAHGLQHDKLRDMNLMPNIPGFDIAYQVGRGAMGSVYRARQKKSGRLVAIKVLSQELALRGDLVARFEREAYALKSLTSKNVVEIIDAGNIDDLHYFAMEFIDGTTLRTRINRSPITLEEAIFITSQILSGLRDAHKHGIIHRDLKPENVLLAYDSSDFSLMPDRVVLVDFGLVGIGGLAFDPHPNLTKSKVTMGTVNYMAPEQHLDAKRVDHRSDLYSAGVILFEMITGDLPLGRYLLPRERGLSFPAELDAILSKALARNLEERYDSAERFLAELQKLPNEENGKMEQAGADGPHAHSLYRVFFKTRYAWLLLIAGLFFALGVRLSIGQLSDKKVAHTMSKNKEAPPIPPKTVINKKK